MHWSSSALFALLPGFVASHVCDQNDKIPCFPLAGGAMIPQVAMGTWSGSYEDCDKTDYTCIKQHARWSIDEWLHIGGTHIDGADVYRTQTSITEAVQASGVKREDVFITTKCPGAIGYQATIQCAEDSMQMLGQYGTKGRGYIDLLLIHFPGVIKAECKFNPSEPACQGAGRTTPATKEMLQDTWRAFEDLKSFGVVKAIGVSDMSVTQLGQILEAATMPIEVNQVEWNPKTHNDELQEFCKSKNILLQAWSPLGGANGAAGSVLSDPTVKEIAAAHSVSTAQVALRWSLQRGVAVVVGTANSDHIKGDLDIFSFDLSDAEISALNGLGASHLSIQI